jgi:hypothetical protein
MFRKLFSKSKSGQNDGGQNPSSNDSVVKAKTPTATKGACSTVIQVHTDSDTARGLDGSSIDTTPRKAMAAENEGSSKTQNKKSKFEPKNECMKNWYADKYVSPKGQAYHTPGCRHLKRHPQLEVMPAEQARKKGLLACHDCHLLEARFMVSHHFIVVDSKRG